MKSIYHQLLGFLLPFAILVSCTKEKGHTVPLLSVDPAEVLFAVEGGNSEITVNSNTDWHISSYSSPWLTYSPSSGGKGTTKVKITASTNAAYDKRSAAISITATNSAAFQVKVRQPGRNRFYPNYNLAPKAPDASGMSNSATQIAAKIKLGWNIGNTLEAIGGETNWGNPLISKQLIQFVKQQGFNAVRIPCTWNQYADAATAKISDTWLKRVKEVIQYCADNDMYAILNAHWDGGWLDNNINAQKQDSTIAKQKAFWEQIATQLRDFDEHLLFAGANEPPVENAAQMEILLSYHQAFVDAVRSTGGRNSYRTLVIQGPSTSIDRSQTLMTTLPSDPVPNRMMVEVHYYEPWQFCGLTEDASWGTRFYYWGADYHSTTDPSRNATWGEEDLVISEFKKMKTTFVDKGIPVVLGEYGAIRRSTLTGDALTLHLASRAYWDKFITKQARINGMLPFYWDEGSIGNHGFGIINRQNNTVGDQQVLDALIQGAQ